MKWLTYLVRSLAFMLFTVFGANMAFAVPLVTSEIIYPQTKTTHFSQGDDVGFAARAPPMAVTNVTVTGGATVRRGSAFSLHGQETVAALFGFGADLNATNRTSDNFLDSTTASGDNIYHGNYSTAIGDDTATLNNFNNAINTGNGHNIIVHGKLDYDDLGGIPTVNGRETNPAQIADAVRSNPNYVEGTQVCFASCWSGSSGSAQSLANDLGAPVHAPSRPVAWNSTTDNWVFDTDVFPSGTSLPRPDIQPSWQTYYPSGD